MQKVNYKKIWGICILSCALFILGVNIVFGFSLNVITGILLALMGSLYLAMPVIAYDAEKIQLKNLFGMTTRTYTFNSNVVTTESGVVYADGQRLKIPVFQLNKNQYHEFILFIMDQQEK